MGVLHDRLADRIHTLPARLLVGRGRACGLRLDGPLVSGEHAVLQWREDAWHVRDLASRNGTFVGAEQVAAGEWVRLRRDAEVAFGDPSLPWTLTDASPPGVMAVRLRDRAEVHARSSVLALPDDDIAAAIIRREGDEWVADMGDEVRPVADLDVLPVDGDAFRIHVPTVLPATHRRTDSVALTDVLVRIGVTRNQEHTEVEVIMPDGPTPIRARTYHYLLVVLGQARRTYHYLLVVLGQARRDDTSANEAEQGWVDAETLATRLLIPKRTMDVQICRIRAQFRDLGLIGADAVVERRGSSVRLGLSQFEVVTLD